MLENEEDGAWIVQHVSGTPPEVLEFPLVVDDCGDELGCVWMMSSIDVRLFQNIRHSSLHVALDACVGQVGDVCGS